MKRSISEAGFVLLGFEFNSAKESVEIGTGVAVKMWID